VIAKVAGQDVLGRVFLGQRVGNQENHTPNSCRKRRTKKRKILKDMGGKNALASLVLQKERGGKPPCDSGSPGGRRASGKGETERVGRKRGKGKVLLVVREGNHPELSLKVQGSYLAGNGECDEKKKKLKGGRQEMSQLEAGERSGGNPLAHQGCQKAETTLRGVQKNQGKGGQLTGPEVGGGKRRSFNDI